MASGLPCSNFWRSTTSHSVRPVEKSVHPCVFSTQWCRQLFLQWLFLTASVRHLIGLFYWLPVAFLPGAWPSFFAAAVCWQANHNQRGKQLEHLEQMDKRVKNLANQRSNQLEHLEQMVKRAKHLANQRGNQLEHLEQMVLTMSDSNLVACLVDNTILAEAICDACCNTAKLVLEETVHGDES